MGTNTKIEWADHTFNPWEGCTKIGPGCDHCYAETRNARFNGGQAINWGPGAPRRRTSESNWQQPHRWNREAARLGIRYRVFCASIADVFDNEVPPEWRVDLLRLIADTPHLDWLLLTKRIGNAQQMMTDAFRTGWPEHGPHWNNWGNLFRNVWIGATVVNQEEADRDIPKLLQTNVVRRFLSVEPMLGFINLTSIKVTQSPGYFGDCLEWYHKPHLAAPWRGIDWVIVGGESGKDARPMHPYWAKSLRDQCSIAGVPFFFKQWGEWSEFEPDKKGENGYPHQVFDMQTEAHLHLPGNILINIEGTVYNAPADVPDSDYQPYRVMERLGKKATGRTIDGRTHEAIPQSAF